MGKDKIKILFHVFISHKLGGGHFSRCLSLAKHMLQSQKFEIAFATNRPDLITLQEVCFLKIDLTQEEKEIQKIFSEINPNVLIYDLLDVDSDYVERTKTAETLTIVFDYYNRTKTLTAADMVFNFHQSADMRKFIDADFYEGIEYGILAEEFYSLKDESERTERNVLVSFGKSDPLGITKKMLDALSGSGATEKTIFHVVTGELNEGKNDYEKDQGKQSIIFYESVENMAALMRRMDYAFVSGGMTLFEAIQLNVVPVVICAHTYAHELATYLENKECAINLGYYQDVNAEKIIAAIKQLSDEKRLQELKGNLCPLQIEGKKRIPEIILKALA